MKKSVFLPLIAFLVVVGFGCQAPTAVKTEPLVSKSKSVSSPVDSKVATEVEVVESSASWILPTVCEKTEQDTVTVESLGETNENFEISLNGKVVKEISTQGEHAMEVIYEMPGMAFVALDPSGIGGYIPYGLNHEALYGVDTCSGQVVEVKNISSISGNGVLVTRTGSDGDKKVTIEVENFGTARSPFTTPEEWTVPGDWKFISPPIFYGDSTQVAFAVANGPDSEDSAVYVLDLSSGKLTKIADKDDGHLYVDGWTASGEVNYR